MVLLWRNGILLALCYLLAEIVEFLVDWPGPESKNTQNDDISDWDKHQQAHSSTITRFGKNSPVNDNSKNDKY